MVNIVYPTKHRSNFFGFTLLEVLLATVISLVLFSVVFRSYFGAKDVYTKQTAMARLTEDIRFANFFLQQNIMHAGFAGCRNLAELNLINHTALDFSEYTVVQGYSSESVPGYLKRIVARNTDVIVITKANSDITEVRADVVIGADRIKVQRHPATNGNQYLLIADCVNAELFVAKNFTGDTVITEDSLHNVYRAGSAQVSRFTELAFFISNTGRVTVANQPIYSLYFSTNRGNKRELITEINDMQIVYGVDIYGQGRVAKYLKAQTITDLKLWDRVLAVVITLQSQHKLRAVKSWQIYIKLRARC